MKTHSRPAKSAVLLFLLLMPVLRGVTPIAPHLANPLASPDGRFTFRLFTTAGASNIVEMSVNLVDWQLLIATNAPTSVLDLVDPNAGMGSARFYRAKVITIGPTPHPLTVVLGLDTNQSVSALIPTDGGILLLTNKTGTIFELSFPTNALLSEETISLTVITNIGGLPLSGGLLSAIKLDPEGLRLVHPAVLSITAPTPLDPTQLLGFTHQGDGSEFHLFPRSVAGRTTTLTLMHFSGYGIGTGKSSDLNGHYPASITAQAEQDFAQAQKDAQDQGLDPDMENIQTIWRDWYERSVRPETQQAKTDEGVLDAAIAEYLDWYRMVDQAKLEVGTNTSAAAFQAMVLTARQALAAGINNAITQAYQRCKADNDPDAEARTMLRRGSLGSDVGLQDYGLDLAAMWTMIRKCLTFRLDFRSEISGPASIGNADATLFARIPLTWDHPDVEFWDNSLGFHHLAGFGPIDYDSFTFTIPPNPDCSQPTISPKGDLLTVKFVRINFDLNIKATPSRHGAIIVSYDPGNPLENAAITCTAPIVGTITRTLFDHPAGFWKDAYLAFHADELNNSLGEYSGIVAQDFVFLGGAIYATKPYVRTLAGGLQETTTIDLLHTPE